VDHGDPSRPATTMQSRSLSVSQKHTRDGHDWLNEPIEIERFPGETRTFRSSARQDAMDVLDATATPIATTRRSAIRCLAHPYFAMLVKD
jgi:hypothetical protein